MDSFVKHVDPIQRIFGFMILNIAYFPNIIINILLSILLNTIFYMSD